MGVQHFWKNGCFVVVGIVTLICSPKAHVLTARNYTPRAPSPPTLRAILLWAGGRVLSWGCGEPHGFHRAVLYAGLYTDSPESSATFMSTAIIYAHIPKKMIKSGVKHQQPDPATQQTGWQQQHHTAWLLWKLLSCTPQPLWKCKGLITSHSAFASFSCIRFL